MKAVTIRPARKVDLPAYTALVQRTSQATYPKPELGLTADLFSPEAFMHPDIQAYIVQRFEHNPDKHVWLAEQDGHIIGTIGLIERGDICEVEGLYVDPAHQRHGIGFKLWQTALKVVGEREVVLDTYAHIPAVDIYKSWGFVQDTRKTNFQSVWPGLAPGHTVTGTYLHRPARPAASSAQISDLAADLKRAEAIKSEMSTLLRDLEEEAAGKPVAKPGGWRHHPTEWAAENLPKD